MKVAFLIAGTQKGGTTALDSYLRSHPSIGLAARKEVHYFDDEQAFASGTADDERYHAWFTRDDRVRIHGEATPVYMYWNSVPARVHRYNPAMKWVLLLRNPVERAFSHWNMERARGAETLPFIEAVVSEAARCAEAAPLQHRVYSYVDRGFYVRQIERIWRLFPRQQTLILRSEELLRRPQGTLDTVCDFLGVERLDIQASRKVHVGSYEQELSAGERRMLLSIFRDEIRNLEKLLSWDCSEWLRAGGGA